MKWPSSAGEPGAASTASALKRATTSGMLNAGLKPEDIIKIKRDAGNYLGFVEVHIEQGPVLNELDLPLGIVTSINGNVRYLCEITGMASHAGTTPMPMSTAARHTRTMRAQLAGAEKFLAALGVGVHVTGRCQRAVGGEFGGDFRRSLCDDRWHGFLVLGLNAAGAHQHGGQQPGPPFRKKKQSC